MAAPLAGVAPLACGLAVADAVERLGGRRGLVGLKWPNDVLALGPAGFAADPGAAPALAADAPPAMAGKLAGILVEVEPRAPGARAVAQRAPGAHAVAKRAPGAHAAAPPADGTPPDTQRATRTPPHASPAASLALVAGVGLNLAVDAFPPGVSGASLHRLLGRTVSVDEALAALLSALGERIAELRTAGPAATVAQWRSRAVGLGAEVAVDTPAGRVAGTALDVADDGALLIQPGGRGDAVRVLAGDVHVVPPGAGPSR
jgi:biotin-(acetyl-CoA carboxylase) ligase